MRLISSITSVGSFTVLSRLFGFVRETLQAYFIGANYISDALQIALRVPSLFRRLFAEGALNASFVPMFSRILTEEGRDKALQFSQNVFTLLALVVLIFVTVFQIFLPDLIPLCFRGLKATPERMALSIEFTRITFPFLLFITLTAFFSGILNSLGKFAIAASSPAIGNLIIIGCLLWLSPYTSNAGYALAWGVFGCGLAQLLWVSIPCCRYGFCFSLRLPKMTPDMQKFLKILLPAALGSGVVQINLFLDIVVASYLPSGGISYIAYADRLNQLPLSVIGVATSTVLLPVLAKVFQKCDIKALQENHNLALLFSLMLCIPAAFMLFSLAPTLIKFVYCHGKFSIDDVMPTAHTLMAFSCGLPAYILVKVLSTMFFSAGDTKTPVVIASFSVLLNVILNIIFLPIWSYVGLAAATAIASWGNAFALGCILYNKGWVKFNKSLILYIGRIIVVSFVATMFMSTITSQFQDFFDTWSHYRIIWMLLMVAMGGGVLVLCFFVGGGHKHKLYKQLRQWGRSS